jgi:hypothetical protein
MKAATAPVPADLLPTALNVICSAPFGVKEFDPTKFMLAEVDCRHGMDAEFG